MLLRGGVIETLSKDQFTVDFGSYEVEGVLYSLKKHDASYYKLLVVLI